MDVTQMGHAAHHIKRAPARVDAVAGEEVVSTDSHVT